MKAYSLWYHKSKQYVWCYMLWCSVSTILQVHVEYDIGQYYTTLCVHKRCYLSCPTTVTQSHGPCVGCCAFSKFHFAFSPVLSGRLFYRRSRRSTAFCCSSGSSDSAMQDWRVTIFQSMHWMSTSTTLSLESETGGKQCRQEPFLAFLMVLLLLST